MSEFKRFTGKSLDEAIEEACRHFDVERNKLEVEILTGGSSGIFGLVGKKKAEVKARPRGAVDMSGKKNDRDERKGKKPNKPAPARDDKPAESAAEAPAQQPERPVEPSSPNPPAPKKERTPAKHEERRVAAEAPEKSPEPAPEPLRREPEPEEPEAERPKSEEPESDEPHAEAQTRPKEEVEPLENPELEELIRDAVARLIEPIVGEAPIKVGQTPDRIKVEVDDEERAGLIIGREGQTLNALQYLLNRIVSKQWSEPVKVQIDAGEYRERQDDKLREMALHLADKAKAQGRPQSTKPLSSYHRRVVHLALQSDGRISTRSKGDGPMKRVLILPKRNNNQNRQ